MRLSNHIRRDKLLDNFINQVFLDQGPPTSTFDKKAAKRARRRHNQKGRRRAAKHPSLPSADNPPDPVAMLHQGANQQSEKELMKRTNRGKMSGSQRRKRKKINAKRSTTITTTTRRDQCDHLVTSIHANHYLRRDHATGRRSLLQDQLDQEMAAQPPPPPAAAAASASSSQQDQPEKWWRMARQHSRERSVDGQEFQANGCAIDCSSACQSCSSMSS